MAVVNIKCSCGCGFQKTVTIPYDKVYVTAIPELVEVLDHVEKTGHTISSIIGTIKPNNK